jgi:hypothetical protein
MKTLFHKSKGKQVREYSTWVYTEIRKSTLKREGQLQKTAVIPPPVPSSTAWRGKNPSLGEGEK